MKMSTAKATTRMIAMIHTLRRHAGLDEGTYRDLLESETGKRSAKDLTVRESSRVIERLRGTTNGIAAGAVAGLDTPVGSKLRALWIAGYDLNVVRDRTDRAMLSFLERQTGVSHVNFLREPGAGSRAIEGLKSWLARERKVEWPANTGDVAGAKRAVVIAQWMYLIELGAITPYGIGADGWQPGFLRYACKVLRKVCAINSFELHDCDELQKALGRKIRAWVAIHDEANDGAAQ